MPGFWYRLLLPFGQQYCGFSDFSNDLALATMIFLLHQQKCIIISTFTVDVSCMPNSL